MSYSISILDNIEYMQLPFKKCGMTQFILDVENSLCFVETLTLRLIEIEP